METRILNKYVIIVMLVASLSLVMASVGCIGEAEKGERAKMLDTQKTETLKYSNERAIFEGYLKQVSDPNNIQWIYCMDMMGHVVLQSAVMGKVISATKSTEPYERALDLQGYDESSDARKFAGFIPGTPQLMNPSGMFGHDTPGAIWLDPQGNYHEWHGGPYLVSNVPIKIKESILSFADVDNELLQKVRKMEQKLRAGGELSAEEMMYLQTVG